MADIVKSLYEGASPTVSTSVYTVPKGKYAVAKSVVICNSNGADTVVRLMIGGTYVAFNHTIKGYGTLVLDELDVPLLEGESIIVMASVLACDMFITGFERDFLAAEYPYLVINASTDSPSTVTAGNDSETVVKSLILCNSTSSAASVTILNGWTLISNKVIKAYDSLIIPLPKIFVPKGREFSLLKLSGSSCRVSIILEKVEK